jgi:hypothetical protein
LSAKEEKVDFVVCAGAVFEEFFGGGDSHIRGGFTVIGDRPAVDAEFSDDLFCGPMGKLFNEFGISQRFAGEITGDASDFGE